VRFIEKTSSTIRSRKGARCPGRREEERREWCAREVVSAETEFECGGFIGKGNNGATTM
jgi:hypothetical protein